MLSNLPLFELEERLFKARAAVGALEFMERELAVIAKSGALRAYKAQFSEIRKAMRNLISTLERTANHSEVELKRRSQRTDRVLNV